MTSFGRSLLPVLLALLAALLVSQPAAGEPLCDSPDPPLTCRLGEEAPEAAPAPVPEPLVLGLSSSGLAFGRDIALAPGGQPVTVEVIEGETLRVSVSARHPSRSVRASISAGERAECVDPATGYAYSEQGLAARREVTAGPGQTATAFVDIAIAKRRHCTVRRDVLASGQPYGLAEVQLPLASFVYRYAARPFGWLDLAAGGAANVRVGGWAIDPETATPIDVHVYVDGMFAGSGSAAGGRPDVGAVHRPYGPAHGFDVTVPARPGTRHVCAYAINVRDGSENAELGCRTVTVALPAACRPIQDEIDGLRMQIALLQYELRLAAPSHKPALIAEIGALQSQLTARQADLEHCVQAAMAAAS
jgi:hypothetical protein